MQGNEQQQRVVGQLVLALRASRLLAGARDVDYELDERGVITVDWVEGPCADEVAAGLAASSSAAGLLEVDAAAPNLTRSRLRADILVGGLPVVLLAHEPMGRERARRVVRVKRDPAGWTWPSPLQDEGAARDTVLWTLDHDHGTVATVVRLPIDWGNMWWSEDGILVATPQQDAPVGVWLTRRSEIDRARQLCAILLRPARGWTVDEADQWMEAELNHERDSRSATAVVWTDRCVVRRSSGLRMEATSDTPQKVPWSYVPAALLSSVWHTKPCRTQPPATMKVRQFGDEHSVAAISVTSTWCMPSSQYRIRSAGGS